MVRTTRDDLEAVRRSPRRHRGDAEVSAVEGTGVESFPFIRTLDQFKWSWPESIDQALVKNIFRLEFMKNRSNVI